MENHHVGIDNRERITVTEVTDVDAFDENTLWANIADGSMEITGEKLNIEKLDIPEGLLIVSGKIGGITYIEHNMKSKKRAIGLGKKLK